MGEVLRLTGMTHAMIYDGVRDQDLPQMGGPTEAMVRVFED